MYTVRTESDIRYASTGGVDLHLDLHLPVVEAPAPVVLYLHGGGWQMGSRTDDGQERIARLASYGVAVASADYRLAPSAVYPAPLHDAKAAVRWLRGHGGEHGLSPEHIGAWGASAGAYLATMIGLTGHRSEFEGTVGEDREQPSTVQAVAHWFGPSDLLANSSRSDVEKMLLNPPFEQALLGVDDVTAAPRPAEEASPLHWITPSAPPFLIAHGERDRVTPPSESRALHEALTRADVSSTLLTLGGAGHEDAAFERRDHIAMTAAFFHTHLAGDSNSGR